jgi:hypothetical protein
MILAVVPIYFKPASAHWPSQELINILLYACIVGAIVLLLRMGRRFLRLGPILEPIRKVWIHDEGFATSRFSMMRIMARRMKAATVPA